MFCNKCLCLFLSYVHAPSRIRHASQVCVSVLHFFIVTVQHPMFSALPPVLSTFFLVPPCPSYVPFVFRFPSSPSCVFRSAVIHSLSGCLLCSHHVSMFPSIHASFSCLRLSHLFSQFLSLCLVLCRIVFPSPQFFILYQPNRLLAFCLECLPICVCTQVHYFALYTVCRP